MSTCGVAMSCLATCATPVFLIADGRTVTGYLFETNNVMLYPLFFQANTLGNEFVQFTPSEFFCRTPTLEETRHTFEISEPKYEPKLFQLASVPYPDKRILSLARGPMGRAYITT